MLHKKSSLLLVLPLVAASAGCPGCNPEILDPLGRRIAVDVCAEPPEEEKGGTQNCSVGFNLSDLSTRVTREITLHNVGEEDLHISGYEFTSDSDPAFRVEHVPDLIKTGLSSRMVVSFRPLLESEVRADLILKTDAQNATVPSDGQILIHLGGTGVDNGLPALQVDVLDGDELKGCCDLGLVAVGSVGTCRVRLTNNGTRDLVLDEVGFDPQFTTSGVWTPVGSLPQPGATGNEERFTIHAGDSAVISVNYRPTDTTESMARLRLRTNAPRACGPVGAFDSGQCNRRDYLNPCPTDQVGAVTVDLRGQGAEPPTCVAKIKSVNGSTSFDPRLIEPLDDVELSAEDSHTAVTALTITGYRWEIRTRPQGSNVRFDNPETSTPHFVFDNSSTNLVTGLDVAGTYEARCIAIDSAGTESINDGTSIVSFTATPSEAIHLQVVWDTDESDVDLHLVREAPAGVFDTDSSNDCYYGNCKGTGSFGNRPLWDTANTAGEGGNPVLDIDDVDGYGPENSNIDAPVPGRYKAVVHYFSDDGVGATVATLRVYVFGNLVAEYTKLISDLDCWDVGNVNWSASGAPTWEPVDTVFNNSSHDCYD